MEKDDNFIWEDNNRNFIGEHGIIILWYIFLIIVLIMGIDAALDRPWF